MGVIRTTVELQDRMTAPLNNMVNAMQSTVNVANKLNDTTIDLNMDKTTSKISSLVQELQSIESVQDEICANAANMYIVPKDMSDDIRKVNTEIERTKAAMGFAESKGFNMDSETYNAQLQSIQNVMGKVVEKQRELNSGMASSPFQTQSPEPVQTPVKWESNNFDVFSSSGNQRYEQEMQSLNSYLQQLYGTQQRISQQAQNTDLFPDDMVADLNTLQGKVEAIRAKVQQIEDNPLNVGSDTANAQLEQLRSQLHQMISDQNQLNSAVEDMDVSGANAAYQRLSSSVSNTEGYIRVNTDAQGQFTQEIQNSSVQASGLMQTIKGAIAAYATMQTVKMVIDISDTLTQTTARLNLMNDGLQTTEELNQKIFESAQRSRSSYMDTANAVAKLGLNAGNAFSSNDELIAFMEQVNKQFKIGGANAQEQSNAMIQLTQAMASGALRGEELNSILDGAPGIARAIEQSMGWAEGSIKSYAAEGAVSATVVKNSLLSMAEETNAKFESMPKTFADVWTDATNQMNKMFKPILKRLNDIANSSAFTDFVTNAMNALGRLANTLTNVFNVVLLVGKFFSDNWSMIAPIIYGIATAVTAYTTALLINNAIQGISNAIEGFAIFQAVAHGEAITQEMIATTGMTEAQISFNAALLACPLTGVILGIIAIIALFYIVIAVINHFCGTSISATGIIMGLLATIAAYLFNVVAGIWNIVSAFIEFFVNVWKNPEYAIKAFIVNIINTFLNFYMAIVQGNGAAIGVIVGAWYAFCQIIHNIIAIVYNAFCDCVERIVNAWNQCVYSVQSVLYDIVNVAFDVANGTANAFDAAGAVIANVFIGAANTAIGAINSIIGALNMIPGVNIGTIGKLNTVSYGGASSIGAKMLGINKPTLQTFSMDRMDIGSIGDAYDTGNQAGQDFAAGFEGTVTDIQNGLQNWLGETPEDYWNAPKLDYINLGDAWNTGYKFGEGVEKTANVENLLNDIASNTGDGADGAKDSADNTGKAVDALDCTDEELKYLRDIAERDVINRFTTAQLKVDFHSENTINSELDIDGVVERFTQQVEEELWSTAEGVHL